MEKQKMRAVIFLFICLTTVSAPSQEQFISKGLIRSALTFSAGTFTSGELAGISNPIYLHGMLNIYTSREISIKGDGFYFIKNDNMVMNHQLFSGAAYHFKTKNNIDPYVGFQPGVSITEFKDREDILCSQLPCDFQYNKAVNPVFSIPAGVNLYFPNWFHLFAEARYVGGRHATDDSSPAPLSEVRFSFGLGINLNVLSKRTQTE